MREFIKCLQICQHSSRTVITSQKVPAQSLDRGLWKHSIGHLFSKIKVILFRDLVWGPRQSLSPQTLWELGPEKFLIQGQESLKQFLKLLLF